LIRRAHPSGGTSCRLSPLRSDSTRKVSKIVEELCGHQVSSTQVRSVVAADIRSIFGCADRAAAEARLKDRAAHYSKSAPKLAAWMEQNILNLTDPPLA
jgi:transposase-like protein